MSTEKINIALDMGYASIGWAVAGVGDALCREPQIIGTGSVIFEPDRCLASERRGFRRQRRHIRATRVRIERMRAFLLERGVLTPAVAGIQHPNPEPWRLAAQVLQEGRVLTPAELWAVLLWYAHNRGYDGNRLWSARLQHVESVSDDEEDDSKKVTAAREAMQSSGRKSMAETVMDIVTNGDWNGPALSDYKSLNMAFPRSVVASEVREILLRHEDRIPGLTAEAIHLLLADPLTEPTALRGREGIPTAYLGGYLFGQTKPRFDNRIVTICPICGDKTPNKNTDAFLEFRWAAMLYRVRVGADFKNMRRLDVAEMKTLNDEVGRCGRFTMGKFKKFVRDLTGCKHDNLNALLEMPESDQALVRYPGLALLDQKFGGMDKFKTDPDSQAALRRISNKLYRGRIVASADIVPLLTEPQAKGEEVYSAPTPDGRAPYAASVMKKAATAIFAGEDPWTVGGILYRDATKENPLKPENIDRATNNHLVRHRVKILLRLIRDIVHDYGENNPARVSTVFLEVARDIKDFSGMKKKNIDAEISSRLKSHKNAVAKVAKDLDIPPEAVPAGMARKMRIASDLNYTCPYTGKKFDAVDIRNRLVDLDHILPRSQRQTDAMDSLVLTFNGVNRKKGNRTALQFIREFGGQTVTSTVPGTGAIVETEILTEEKYLQLIGASGGKNGKAFKLKPAVRLHPREARVAERRMKKLAMLSVTEESGMTEGMLTQTSAINKLSANAIRGWFVERKCRQPHIITVPGRITKEVRSHWNLAEMLAQFDCRLLKTYEEDGKSVTRVIPKGEMRSVTHMHHAVDAIAILLSGTMIAPRNDIWNLMLKRHLSEEEEVRLLASGPFAKTSGGHFVLQPLPPTVETSVRKALGELRAVRYTSKRMNRTVLEQTQWRVVKVENGRVFLRQRQNGVYKTNEIALSAAYGLKPKNGTGKLKKNQAIYVGDSNYGIALSQPPQILRNRFVWAQLRELAVKNGGKRPAVLRKGDLIQLTENGRDVIWMIRSIKDNKGKLLLDLSVPFNAEGAQNGVTYWKINKVLSALIAKYKLMIPHYSLTGIPSCPITSLKSPASKRRTSTAKTDSSSAE